MINIVSKRCEYPECNIICSFNFEGEKTPKYCATHKTDGMIHLSDTFFCKEINCNKRPSFNYKGIGGPKYFLLHCKVGMTNVKDATCNDCDIQASFNYSHMRKPKYCVRHKKPGMINVESKRCIGEDCDIIIKQGVRNRYENYCINCYSKKYPEKNIINNHLKKEIYIRNYIQSTFTEYQWKCNETLKNEENKTYRPDMLCIFEDFNIIIEIDEYQHTRYDEEEEENRMVDIYNILKKRIIFVRFNPDSYTDKNSNFIKSPWIYNNTELTISTEEEIQTEWLLRLDTLKNTVKNIIDNNFNGNINLIRLFYSD